MNTQKVNNARNKASRPTPFKRHPGASCMLALALMAFPAGGTLLAQSSEEEIRISNLIFHDPQIEGTNKHPKHQQLQTELELYPFNIVVPNDPVIKNEVMFDYHLYSDNEKVLAGLRFFTEANTHYSHERDMKDLLMYTEGYIGYNCLQVGVELGSITGIEYFTIGPQVTMYDNAVFKRLSLVSRVYPDLVFGYEFTSQELRIIDNVNISATGMCRILLPCDERIIQVSTWLSHERLKGFFVGVEYEFNNAEYFNAHTYERNHEFFLGLKFELQ